MSDLEGTGGEQPVTVPTQGADTLVTGKETTPPAKVETTPNTANIPQSEWQQMQEELRATRIAVSQTQLQAFEKNNPIVLKDQYLAKWEELKRMKNTPGHKYANLDWEDLLHKLHGEIHVNDPMSAEPRMAPPPMTVPSVNPSVSPDLPSGSMSKETRDFLSLRFTDEEIKRAERSA